MDQSLRIEDPVGSWEVPLREFIYGFVRDDSSGHSFYHCWRVRNLAIRIADGEGLDRSVMVAAAYLHDVGRAQEREGGGDHVDFGMAMAREILPKISFPDDKTESVVCCVKYHERYAWVSGDQDIIKELKGEILGFQDADRLDAIGAIGVARAFAFGGAHQLPLWVPRAETDLWRHGKLSRSSYTHLHEKLLKLGDTMHTETGRELARVRHEFMLEFAKRFEDEWFGRL